MSKNNTLAKSFTIAGAVLGEIYMLFTVLAPNAHGVPVPLATAFQRVLALSLFFGPFGGAVGLGAWLLLLTGRSVVQSTKEMFRPSAKPLSSDAHE